MSVTFPRGFSAAGLACGIKENGKKDLALVVNNGSHPASAAQFTRNRFAAAPVVWSKTAFTHGTVRAIVLNSGGANACTGIEGAHQSRQTAHTAASLLGIEPREIAVCSTGLIGELLPLEALLNGLDAANNELGEGEQNGNDAAEAIMTTDTHPKTATEEIRGVRFGGMAKGAGMLAPELATMLVVVTTDAIVSQQDAHKALEYAIEHSFNRIDSDGCMSTNDTVILLASGESGIELSYEEMCTSLTAICQDLARQLIGDAEGASHDISITVTGASSQEAGLACARAVARSNLFKAAIFGNDPNWGRILSALGTVPEVIAPFDPEKVDVAINGVWICKGGGRGEDRSQVAINDRNVRVDIALHAGNESVTILTNDLTYDYVTENSAYSS